MQSTLLPQKHLNQAINDVLSTVTSTSRTRNTSFCYNTRMSDEVLNRAEGQSKRTLFPLSEDALMTASCALKDALKGEDITRVRGHIHEVRGRPYVGRMVNQFFLHRHRELPEIGGHQNFYAFGAAISLDAIGAQSALDTMQVTPISYDDLEAYKIIRKKIVEPSWFKASDDVLILLEKRLSDFLRDADNSYSRAAEEVEEQDRDRVGLVQNISFLLGLCDMYFPYRYADERVRIMQVSD